jgi:hypothetical protein
MSMPNDPYAMENRFALAAVAGNAFNVTPSDSADLPVGVKAVHIENRNGSAWQRVDVVPVNADSGAPPVQINVPPNGFVLLPLRVQRVRATSKGADIYVVAYTDGNVTGSI